MTPDNAFGFRRTCPGCPRNTMKRGDKAIVPNSFGKWQSSSPRSRTMEKPDEPSEAAEEASLSNCTCPRKARSDRRNLPSPAVIDRRCDVEREQNAGAYLGAVTDTVCHIPGDYLSKATGSSARASAEQGPQIPQLTFSISQVEHECHTNILEQLKKRVCSNQSGPWGPCRTSYSLQAKQTKMESDSEENHSETCDVLPDCIAEAPR
ncbi:uncharacterized protein LOC107663353 [Sinocyclocheilus anshuiensis]|uniref:uncharacterized protein LOC107663353 n=1 Tax=Sinocyclocheilus anshuiensis TaxID=1608454 RepID=UPI0007B94A4C|nr:PREDICTED: uncharacterized protein LOC107663353 [Sinocyclocheilus anshuiensis]